MGIKAALSKPFAAWVVSRTNRWKKDAVASQERVLKSLIAKARATSFGKDHKFDEIKSYDDFKRNVPVRDYEDLRPYIERVVEGEPDVLWPGKPAYFAKTS